MKKTFTLCLVLIFCFFISVFCCVSASAKSANNDNIILEKYNIYTSSNIYSNLYVSENNYNLGAEIDLVICFSMPSEITNIMFEADGFLLKEDFDITNNNIYFSVIHIETSRTPYLNVEINGANGEKLAEKMFGIVNDNRLFVDPHAYFFAERAYEYYLKNSFAMVEENQILTNVIANATANLKSNDIFEITSTNSIHDTTINGKLEWKDHENQTHPLRFVRIFIYRTDVSPAELIYTGCTDVNGQFTCTFANDPLDGISDLSLVVSACGMDVEICDSYGNIYLYDYNASDTPALKDIPATTNTINITVFNTEESNVLDEYDYFCHAVQISQSAISAAKFYEEMKGNDIEDITIIYPYLSEEDNYNQTAFYDIDSKTICLGEYSADHLSQYEACDVITHEYGHHIAFCENIVQHVNGWHGYSVDMAEHYLDHHLDDVSEPCNNMCAIAKNAASNFNFTRYECKVKGCQIAWSEGIATFLGEISQQYFYENYITGSIDNIKPTKFADGCYTDYESTEDTVLETKLASKYSESIEETIQCFMYDLYDDLSTGNNEDFDTISLSYTVIWDLLIDSDAYTLYEFVEFFKQNHDNNDDIIKLGDLLSGMNMPFTNFEIEEFNTLAPTIRVTWLEPNSNGFYCWRIFKINFYNYYNLELIGSSDITTLYLDHDLNGYIVIDDELWSDVLNQCDKFYITLTVYEGDGDIDISESNNRFITSYESKYFVYDVKELYTLIFNNYNGTHNLTYTENSNEGKYHWYAFTAKATEEYVFNVLTPINIRMDIFPELAVGDSNEGALHSIFYISGFGECKIVASLIANQTVYIRITGIGNSTNGSYTLSVSTPNHTHIYNSSYLSIGTSLHKSFCSCGDYITEHHIFVSSGIGYSCKYCKYFTKYIMIPISGTKKNIDFTTTFCYNEDEDE